MVVLFDPLSWSGAGYVQFIIQARDEQAEVFVTAVPFVAVRLTRRRIPNTAVVGHRS